MSKEDGKASIRSVKRTRRVKQHTGNNNGQYAEIESLVVCLITIPAMSGFKEHT
jgi:hypothetical protein